MALNVLVLAQTFYLFNSRYINVSSLSFERLFNNKVAWLMVGILLLLQLAYVYLPFMNRWFGSYPLSFGQWVISAIWPWASSSWLNWKKSFSENACKSFRMYG